MVETKLTKLYEYKNLTNIQTDTYCTHNEYSSKILAHLAVGCKLSEYTEWTPCSVSCGYGGIQSRHRVIINEPRHGGTRCGPLVERKYCDNLQPCIWICKSPEKINPNCILNWMWFKRKFCKLTSWWYLSSVYKGIQRNKNLIIIVKK